MSTLVDGPPPWSGSQVARPFGPGSEGRLRIALVTEYYYPHLGGVTEHVHFFAAELRRRGHHVDVITGQIARTRPEPGIIRLGQSVPIYSNGSMARITLGERLRATVRATLRDGGYDLVHVHAPFSPTLPILAIEEARQPVVGTVHSWFPRSMAYRLLQTSLQRLVDRIDALIAVSPAAMGAHDRYFDADWKIIPNGIDLDLFHPGAPRPRLYDDRPVVLFVGRFDPRNALGVLLDAFGRVVSPRRQAQLVVLGDGPLDRFYRWRASGMRNVTFAGRVVAERPQFYANAALYACPTTRASFGMTLLEAMASATPIICSQIPGFTDLATNGHEALMFPLQNVGALSDALATLLDDEGRRAQLGANGRRTALRYGWAAVADQVLATYDRVLGRVRLAA